MPAAIESRLHDVLAGNMNELYWLTYLLTGDRSRSEAAYVNTVGMDERNPCVGEFMSNWARKLIVSSALGTIRPQLQESAARVKSSSGNLLTGSLPLMSSANSTKMDLERAILAIDAFPGCALVLTVFEGMPASEAARLLGVETKLVKTAQAIGLTELTRNMTQRASEQPGHDGAFRSETAVAAAY